MYLTCDKGRYVTEILYCTANFHNLNNFSYGQSWNRGRLARLSSNYTIYTSSMIVKKTIRSYNFDRPQLVFLYNRLTITITFLCDPGL